VIADVPQPEEPEITDESDPEKSAESEPDPEESFEKVDVSASDDAPL
jgi:hypothetical protein